MAGGHHPRRGSGGEVLVDDAVGEVTRGLGGSPAAALSPVPGRRAERSLKNWEGLEEGRRGGGGRKGHLEVNWRKWMAPEEQEGVKGHRPDQ